MRPQADSVLVIACGAIAREIHQLKRLNEWSHMDLQAIDARLHFTPDRIPQAVRDKLAAAGGIYRKIYVAFADCGTYGALDRVLEEFDVERLPGLHCYATFAGQARFEQFHEEEPGTFYLTDFLVRHFERLVVSALKIDTHPELKQAFFGNYSRVIFLAQTANPALRERAREIAQFLELHFCEVNTGCGELVPELASFVGERHAVG
ncbi:MAG: DUF1638 domain-containing protein [Gammaproteobacteria bacterium]